MVRLFILLFSLSVTSLFAQNPNNSSSDKHTVVRNYSDDGALTSVINYVNGNPYGKYEYFYADGTLMEEGIWHINHQVGELKRYDEEGNISQLFNFDNSGNRYGEQIYYYPSGAVKARKYINNNDATSEISRYSDNGEIESLSTL